MPLINRIVITVFFLFSGIAFAYSQSSVLEKMININVKNLSTKDILKQISQQTNYHFTYNPEIISENKKCSFSYKKASLRSVLNNTLSDSTLTYKIVEDHIIICKKTELETFYFPLEIKHETYIKISGKIIDEKTNKPLPYASIGILNSSFGTVSNENGVFYLKVKPEFKDSSLFIAHLGYKTLFSPILKARETENTFSLIEDFVSLQEVIIRSNDPLILLKKAIERKEKNYCQSPNILTAFYREGIKRKDKLLNLSEAVIKIYKTPYKTSFAYDKVKVDKSRKIINAEISDTVFLKLKDGLYSGLELDFMKTPIDFLDENNFKHYNYKTEDIVTSGDKQAYVIEFFQKENIQNALYKGRIYIELESFAIIAAEFELNINAETKPPNFVAKKHRRLKVKPISAKYIVSYRQANNSYILNHVRADLDFKIKKKRSFFSSKYKAFFETVVVNIDSLNPEKFNKKDVVKRNQVFIDNNYQYDKHFWGSHNYIKPEESIENALKQIRVKLNYKK